MKRYTIHCTSFYILLITGCQQEDTTQQEGSQIVMMIQSMKIMFIQSMILM